MEEDKTNNDDDIGVITPSAEEALAHINRNWKSSDSQEIEERNQTAPPEQFQDRQGNLFTTPGHQDPYHASIMDQIAQSRTREQHQCSICGMKTPVSTKGRPITKPL